MALRLSEKPSDAMAHWMGQKCRNAKVACSKDNWPKQKGLNLTTSKIVGVKVLLCEKWLMLCTLIAKRNTAFLRHLCKGGITPKSRAHVTQNSHFLSGPILLLCLWDAWEPQCSLPKHSLVEPKAKSAELKEATGWARPLRSWYQTSPNIKTARCLCLTTVIKILPCHISIHISSSHLQQSYWCIVACCYLWLVGPRVTRPQFFIGPCLKFPTPPSKWFPISGYPALLVSSSLPFGSEVSSTARPKCIKILCNLQW